MLPFVTLSVTGDGPRAPGLQAGEGWGEGGAREAVHHPGHGQRRDGGGVITDFVFEFYLRQYLAYLLIIAIINDSILQLMSN